MQHSFMTSLCYARTTVLEVSASDHHVQIVSRSLWKTSHIRHTINTKAWSFMPFICGRHISELLRELYFTVTLPPMAIDSLASHAWRHCGSRDVITVFNERYLSAVYSVIKPLRHSFMTSRMMRDVTCDAPCVRAAVSRSRVRSNWSKHFHPLSRTSVSSNLFTED